MTNVRVNVSPEAAADTIGAVDGADSGAGHEAEAGPLVVHVRGEGVGDACAEGELCAAGGDDAPQPARRGTAAAMTANIRTVKLRSLTLLWSGHLPRVGTAASPAIYVPFGTVTATRYAIWLRC